MGSGLSVLNFGGALADPADLDDLLIQIDQGMAQWVQQLPNSVTFQVANEVEVREEDTGDLISTLTGASVPPRVGSATSSIHAAGVGGRVRWVTAGIRNGRPVIGTTFIVPMGSSAFEVNGTITAAALANLTAGGELIRTQSIALGVPVSVWSKPTSSGGSDGVLWPVDSINAPDQAAWLTSRRQ